MAIEIHVEYQQEYDSVEIYKVSVNSMEELSLIALLQGRNVYGKSCYLYDDETSVWIRIPSDRILRNVLDFNSKTFIVKFQEKSPNTSAASTPDKTSEPLSDGSRRIELFTSDNIEDLDPKELVYLPKDGSSGFELVLIHSSHLYGRLKTKLYEGIHPYAIEVTIDNDTKVTLSKRIWTQFLVRGKHHTVDKYLDLMATLLGNLGALEEKMKELHANDDLWGRVKIFHYDLMNFSGKESSQQRLNLYYSDYFMSSVYFSEEERQYLLDFPTSSGLCVKDILMIAFSDKGKEAGVLCTSHDIAPVVASVFGIRKAYEKKKKFQNALNSFEKVLAKKRK